MMPGRETYERSHAMKGLRMTIRLMVTGALLTDPIERTTAKNTPYATFTLRSGEGDAAVLVNCAAFDQEAATEILAARKAELLCVTGRGELRSWIGKDGAEKHGLSCTVDRVLTLHGAQRTRSPYSPPAEPSYAERASLPALNVAAAFAEPQNDF